jgi:AcrR family transcriptional regulator
LTLSQGDIVSAAIELLDDDGLNAVTLRALANRLGVTAPTLYWHIRGKRHLLDLMAERIFTNSIPASLEEPAPGQPWWEWLAERSRAMRKALLAHPDGALVAAGNRPTPGRLPHIEKMLAALAREGFAPTEALRAVIAIGSYAIGDALETQSRAARGPEEASDHQALREAILSGEHPTLANAIRDVGTPDQRFEYGLSLLLYGMRSRLLEASDPRKPSRAKA